MWELLAEGLLWTPGYEILLNGTRSVVKASSFWGLQAVLNIKYNPGTVPSHLQHTHCDSQRSRKASGFPPWRCVGEEQLTCPTALSHSQGITTVPLPSYWPSHQTLYYSVGESSPVSACVEGTGQTTYCQTILGVVHDSTAQPLVFLGEGVQGPTDDENNWCAVRRVQCQPAVPHLLLLLELKRKKTFISKVSSSPSSCRAHVL